MSERIRHRHNEEHDETGLLTQDLDHSAESHTHSNNGALLASMERSLNGAIVHQDEEDLNNVLLSSSSRSHKEYVVYTERWFILAVFSLLALVQSCGWNTWGPIENTASVVLGWKQSTFALLANWGAIVYVLTAFFFSWLLHAKGLRVAVLLAAGALVSGMGIRCLPVPVHSMIWTAHIGQVIIGLSAPILMAGVTTISAVWFPTNERTTATAISSTMAYLGVAVSFLIGPQIVPEILPVHTNFSTVSPIDIAAEGDDIHEINPADYDPVEVQQCLRQIKLLLFIEFIWTLLLLIVALIYFPSAPITPPTASAIAKREDMKEGLLQIVKKKEFWIPALIFGMTTGCFNSWNTQLVAIFDNKADQSESSWIGFYSNLAGVIGGIIFGKFVDRLGGKMKAILILLMFGACGGFVWVLLLANSHIPYSTVYLYASVILFAFFVNSMVPIIFEVTAEGAFPTGEETSCMFMTWLANVTGLIFLLLPIFITISSLTWLNWVMLGALGMSLVLLLFYKEHYARKEFDVTHHNDIEEEECDLNPTIHT
nr:solute carrier family 49 member 4 homolog isoform X1 [Lytechinus pictus]